MSLTEYQYNTLAGLNETIVDLDSLHKVLQARREACKTEDGRRTSHLNEFVFNRVLLLDQFGQLLRIKPYVFVGNTIYNLSEQRPSDRKVLTYNTFRESGLSMDPLGKNNFNWEMTFTSVPKSIDCCKFCGLGWEYLDLSDSVPYVEDDLRKFYHGTCYKKDSRIKQIEFFKSCLQEAGLDINTHSYVTNTYDSGEHGLPWVKFQTGIGFITLGRRKRVYVLDYSKIFAGDLFQDSESTHYDGGVHAWSEEELVVYLKRLQNNFGGR